MSENYCRSYPINQSPFYKLKNKKKLLKFLYVSESGLSRLSSDINEYRCWDEPKKNGGTRRIEAPPEGLKAVQKRISDLLLRVKSPPYLMAPARGRSYVHNAAVHVGSRAFRLLDIEDFFPSCTEKKVYWFFSKRLGCSPDVSALVARLATFGGHLPQGSPCSPILAYYAYCDMWEEINRVVSGCGCKLSIYVDDITISGPSVPEDAIWRVKQALHRSGHRYSRRKERSIVGRAADVTGVIVSGDDLLLPNRQHLQLMLVERRRSVEADPKELQALNSRIRGRLAQARQITGHLEEVKRIKSEESSV